MRIPAHLSDHSEGWQELFVAGRTHEEIALAFFENSWLLVGKSFNVVTFAAKFLLLLLRMMIGWEQEDVSEVCLTFFFWICVSLNEFRPFMMMRVKLLENLLHGTLHGWKCMFLMLHFQSQMFQSFLKRRREWVAWPSWPSTSHLLLFRRKLRVLFIFALILKAYDFKLIWDSIDHTFRNIQISRIPLFLWIQFHQKCNQLSILHNFRQHRWLDWLHCDWTIGLPFDLTDSTEALPHSRIKMIFYRIVSSFLA